MRKAIKSVLEALALGPAAISRWLHRGDRLILAYHNIVPYGRVPGGDISLHLPQAAFASQLDVLIQLCDVVPLERLINRDEKHGRPRVAITFDDAYQGAVTAGVVELQKRNLPATFFVAPGLLEGQSFWWDTLVTPGALSLPSETRTLALTKLQGQGAEIRRWARSAGKKEIFPEAHATGATSGQLAHALGQHQGLVLAAHSWSHPNLTTVQEMVLREELTRPLEWLLARFDRVVPYIAYPYGLGDSRVKQAAQQAGYLASFLISGGWIGRSACPWDLPRLNVPSGISLNGFELRISGINQA